VRIRGELQLLLSSATAALNGYTGAFGIGIVTGPAFAAGVGSVPTPITDIEWNGWMYWKAIPLVSAGVIDGSAAADTDAITGHTVQMRVEIDSKAMRKINFEETVFAALEVTERGTAVLNWSFITRILTKIP